MSNGRRSLRLFFKFGLLVSLPLAGYLAAQMGAAPVTIAAAVVCVVMAFGAEGLASSAESRLAQLRSVADTEDRSFASESAGRDEKIRQMDRIVDTLSNQNHDLRGKLVSLQSEAQRLDEESAEPQPAPDAEPAAEEAAQDSGGGEVTDISTLRTRR